MSAPISPLTELPGCEHFSLQSVSLYLTSSNPPRNPVKEKLLVLVQKKRAPSAWPEFTRLKTVAQSPIPQLLALNVRFSSAHSSAELGSELFRFWVLSTRVYMILQIITFLFSLVLLLEMNLENAFFSINGISGACRNPPSGSS